MNLKKEKQNVLNKTQNKQIWIQEKKLRKENKQILVLAQEVTKHG